jgi:tetratricopeptide (TPR) repeat protein
VPVRVAAASILVLLSCTAQVHASDDPQRLIEAFRKGDERARADALKRLYDLGSPATAPLRREAKRLLATLRIGDVTERNDALQRLSELGRAAAPVLADALRDSDPDVRFNALFLLNESAGRLKRSVRAVVEGRPSNAASFPEALDAYAALLDLGERLTSCSALVRLVRRQAVGASSAKPRYVSFGLSLIAELVTRNPKLGTERLAFELASLLEVDLRVGHHELISAFAALPPEHTLKALDASLAAGRPVIAARAARVLAEALPLARSPDAAHRIVPLFKHPNTLVRLSALRAIDLLRLPNKALITVIPLVRDRDPTIAGEALRMAGVRQLTVVREGAEGLAADLDTPAQLRRRAVLTLGLLGPGGSSGKLLRRLANPNAKDRRLAALSAWAMGASRAPGARKAIERLLGFQGFPFRELLFRGLARLGGEEGLAALEAMLEFNPGVPFKRERRGRAVVALGFLRDAPDASAVLGLLANATPAVTLREQKPTALEIKSAVEGLANRNDDEASLILAQLLVDNAADPKLLVELLARIGGPRGDAALSTRLAQELGRITRNNGNLFVRGSAATALSKVDPLRAQKILAGLLRRGQHPRAARDLARALARAGDPSQIATRALPYSKAELNRAEAGDRADLLNDVGIDLLYAGRLDEALLEFRRMLWCRPDDKIATYNVACGYALGGDSDRALRFLRRSIGLDYRNHRHIVYDTDLDGLHGDPRYQRLIGELKLFEETGVSLPKYAWPGT